MPYRCPGHGCRPGSRRDLNPLLRHGRRATPAALQTSRTTQQGDDMSGLVSKDQTAVAYAVRRPDDITQPPSPPRDPLPSARMGIRDGAANNMPMPTQQEETPMSAPAAMEQPNARTAFLRRRGGNAETLRWEPRGWKLGPKAPRQQNRTMAAWYPSLINDPWLGSRLLQQPRRKGLEIWWTLWPWKGRT